MNKRDKEFRVEQISNGYVVEYSGRNDHDEWENIRLFVRNLQELFEDITAWESLEVVK